MAINIPQTSSPGASFQQGFKSVNDLFSKIRQHQIESEKLQEAVRQHAEMMKFKQSAENRAQRAEGRNQQLSIEKLKALKNQNADSDYLNQGLGGSSSAPSNGSGMQPEGYGRQPEGVENPNTGALNGEHEVDANGQPVAQQENIQTDQSNQQNPIMQMIKDRATKDPKFRALFHKKYGYDPLASIPESPDVKRAADIETDKTKAQNEQDIKQAQKLREHAKDLEIAGMDLEGIHDLLTGPDSLGTGITSSLVGKLGWGSEKLGGFNERALQLQTQMTKALSARGGVGAAKIVEKGKPSTWKSTSENLGITDAYAARIKNEFELLNQEYKNITKKDLPYTLPEYVHNIGKKIEKNMFKPKTVFNTEKEYHDYMISLTPEQKKLAINALRNTSK